ncbi:HEAT repeat domain-containing protein [Paenibacillus macerans]|uniref:HEAT repeat domain-containing protein n=1 Tax=Paenibacillus macerans TaxID=44252 RepID=UPI003D312EA1
MNMERQDMESNPDYKELRKAANRTSNWRERLQAVEVLGQHETEQSIEILTHIMNHDAVHGIQAAAYRKLIQFGLGVQMPPKRTDELFKGLTKMLVRIKKSLPEGHTFEQFEEKLKKMRIDVYDTYEGAKGEEFGPWLKDKWASLSTDRRMKR